ncbi:MAG TPA: hypothetical protein VFS43_33740, partial [Polyangiaceae bacterium]|nr:hypothetical protein [Polyangiaceae bacterium]
MSNEDHTRQSSERRLTPWRPAKTVRQEGAAEVDWTRTYHVDTVEGFVNGLYGLYSHAFGDFLKDVGESAEVGDTVLYQVKDPVHLRFEMKKLGPNEYQVRGAHFATLNGTNICVGLNPSDEWTQKGANTMYTLLPTTTGTPYTTAGTPYTTAGTPYTTTAGTPYTTTGTPYTTTAGTPYTTTAGTPYTTTAGTPYTTTAGTPYTTTGGTTYTATSTPTTTTGTPYATTTGTPHTTTMGTPYTTTGTPYTTTGTPYTTAGSP